MSRESIFVVEDELHIQQLVKYNLEASDYKVHTFDTGEALLQECMIKLPDMFILDLMLPGIDGIEICRQLKQNEKAKTIPIIMLTAKSEEADRVLGLELGADDYITKPFSVLELIARVKALFRRSGIVQPESGEQIRHGDIVIDVSRREVYKSGLLVEMPLKEYELLKLLMTNKGKVLSRDIILEKVWGFDYYGETRTIDVHIRFLRQKLESDGSPAYIESIRGIGYRFNDREN